MFYIPFPFRVLLGSSRGRNHSINLAIHLGAFYQCNIGSGRLWEVFGKAKLSGIVAHRIRWSMSEPRIVWSISQICGRAHLVGNIGSSDLSVYEPRREASPDIRSGGRLGEQGKQV